MQHLSNLSKWAKNIVPPIFIILSLISGGIYYRDNVRELKFWLNSPSFMEQIDKP